MLATMAGDSPWQNPLDPSDLNCDGDVSPSDALVAINAINSGMSGQLDLKSAPPMLAGIVKGAVSDFMDVDGDGQLSPADALTVINDLNVGRHNGGGFGNLPTDDQQGNDIAHATPLTLSDRGFAKVKALINSDGDVDVFQVTPTKTQLSVGLFSAASGVMTVSVVDAAGTELDSVSTEAGKHHPVNLNVTVDTTKSYFLVVSGAAGVTGPYGLTVLNFTDLDFKPETDSELGDDIHGDDAAGATLLTLNHFHARVSSNIDAAGDKDFFKLDDVSDGKLIVEAGAEFPLNVEVTDAEGKVLGSILTSDKHAVVVNVTAPGPYFISVAAANGTDTGAYHVNVVNAPIPSLPGHHDGDDDDGDDNSGPPDDHHVIPTPAELFAKLDANTDQSVSHDEFAAGVPFGHSAIADRIFANWDADKDGALSMDEFLSGIANLHLPGLPGRRDHGSGIMPIVTNG